MNRSEKGYFKKYSALHTIGEKNNYINLFEAIDKQKEYNEDKLLEKFHNEKFITQFPVAKNYLTSMVLKSLRAFYSGKSIETKLDEKLLEIDILYKKGLLEFCKNELKKTKRLAKGYEKHTHYLRILNWERRIQDIQSFSKSEEKK
ncbi:MAG: hypothetical protein J5I47_08390 [Vicingus serpentipes]|nr:hypothetical protein [Vicingus serpentipes]